MSTDHEADSAAIAEGIKNGVKESKLRLTDRRLLILFVLGAVAVAFFAWRADSTSNDAKRAAHAAVVAQQVAAAAQAKTIAAAIANCQVINAGNMKVNAILHQLAINASNTSGLTPSAKAAALATYSQLQLPLGNCAAFASK